MDSGILLRILPELSHTFFFENLVLNCFRGVPQNILFKNSKMFPKVFFFKKISLGFPKFHKNSFRNSWKFSFCCDFFQKIVQGFFGTFLKFAFKIHSEISSKAPLRVPSKIYLEISSEISWRILWGKPAEAVSEILTKNLAEILSKIFEGFSEKIFSGLLDVFSFGMLQCFFRMSCLNAFHEKNIF